MRCSADHESPGPRERRHDRVRRERQNHGIAALGVSGFDEAQLGKCLDALAAADHPGSSLVHKKVGALTKYWEKGKAEDHDPLYVAWLAKDVVAIGIDAGHPDDLNAALAGGTLSGGHDTSVVRSCAEVRDLDIGDLGTIELRPCEHLLFARPALTSWISISATWAR